jgi:arginyl-tRNA synthetase
VKIEDDLVALIRRGLAIAAPALGIEGELPTPELLATKQKEHGDFATNVALALAKRANRSPRDVAQAIAEALPSAPYVEKVEIAGPGFLNVFTTDTWLHEALRDIASEADSYGRAGPTGRRVQVEFVSANPTGPLHVGHARNAALGDALARLLEAAGETVEREYYFNDAGRQMELFGASVRARYLQQLGRAAELPEDGYRGEYLVAIAAAIVGEHGEALAELPEPERTNRLLAEGAGRVLAGVERTLERFGVHFDLYFS